jgi:pyruvyltransferase
MAKALRAFWSLAGNNKNFGDQLTPFKEICGVKLERVREYEAPLFACGSILELVPGKYEGTILGSGLMYAKTKINLSRARVLALRGKLTLERCGKVGSPVLGDFGLALRHIAPRTVPKIELGEIPHHVVYFAGGHYGTGGKRIDICGEPRKVIEQAAGCKRIASSSLHGLVLADVLGIENMWIPDNRVNGEGFKFRDYASALGQEIEPNVWRMAPQEKVEEIGEKLVGLMKACS